MFAYQPTSDCCPVSIAEDATMGNMTGFDAILISALTSTAVALAIEWTAKPNLEVRKERILELSKIRHEIIRQLHTAVFLGQFLGAYVSDMPSLSPEMATEMHQYMTTYYNNFTKAINSATVLYPEVASKINPRIQLATASAFGTLQGLADRKDASASGFKEVITISELLISFLELPRWNFIKCSKLLLLAKANETSELTQNS
jgi:hypothetical protein